MRLFIVCIICTFLTGCATLQEPIPVDPGHEVIFVRVASKETSEDEFHVRVDIRLDYNMPGIVNEIYLPNGKYLVEYFEMTNGCMMDNQIDHHSAHGEMPSVYRRFIFTYPAEVEGVDATELGFAELPQNRTGSIRSTTSGINFNKHYHENHTRQGHIVSDRRDLGRWWMIEFKDKKVSVTMDLRP